MQFCYFVTVIFLIGADDVSDVVFYFCFFTIPNRRN